MWREFGPLLERLTGRRIDVVHADWRPGDQHAYVSDIRKLEAALGWTPQIAVPAGVGQLMDWVAQNRDVFDRTSVSFRRIASACCASAIPSSNRSVA